MAIDRHSLPDEYKEIYDNFIMPVDTNIDFNSVILSDENRKKINDFIRETQNRDKLLEYGLEPMNRILLYGASGTGKTYMTKALSNYLGYDLLYIDIANALTDENAPKNISNIVKLANYLKNCIVMLDECDSIAWQRDGGGESGHIRRTTNTVFTLMDNMDPSLIWVSATNMLHRLDNAFERRHSFKMEFRRPELDIKDAIQHFILPKFEIVDDVDDTTVDIVSRRASQHTKLSYYELQGLVEKAMKKAVIENNFIVRTSDVYSELAIAMNVKLRFKTGLDDEEIFQNKHGC